MLQLLPTPLFVRLARRLIACAVVAALCMGARLPNAPLSEHAVKAAVLYRAAKFIDWPSHSFSAANAPFVMCVVGSESSLQAFDGLQGKQISAHPVTVRRITGDMLDLRQCHAAFFPDDGGADIDYALGKLEGAPVLTVGETEDFAQRGGLLALVTLEQRVRFFVNLDASKHAGFTFSSQLLQLSTVVGDSKS